VRESLTPRRAPNYDATAVLPETCIRLDGQSRTTLVTFGETGVVSLLGVYALEGFGLAPDAISRRLVPVSGVLK